jgi:hypothetical protein
MNTAVVQTKKNNGLIALLGFTAALLVVGVLTHANATIGIGDRLAFFALVVIGMTMCSLGGITQAVAHGWWHPLSIVGYIIGTLALLLAAAVWFNIPVPMIATERDALIALAVMMLVKLGVARLYR